MSWYIWYISSLWHNIYIVIYMFSISPSTSLWIRKQLPSHCFHFGLMYTLFCCFIYRSVSKYLQCLLSFLRSFSGKVKYLHIIVEWSVFQDRIFKTVPQNHDLHKPVMSSAWGLTLLTRFCVAVSCLSDWVLSEPQQWAPAPAEPARSAPAVLASSGNAEQQLELKPSEPELRRLLALDQYQLLELKATAECTRIGAVFSFAYQVLFLSEDTRTVQHHLWIPAGSRWAPPRSAPSHFSSRRQRKMRLLDFIIVLVSLNGRGRSFPPAQTGRSFPPAQTLFHTSCLEPRDRLRSSSPFRWTLRPMVSVWCCLCSSKFIWVTKIQVWFPSVCWWMSDGPSSCCTEEWRLEGHGECLQLFVFWSGDIFWVKHVILAKMRWKGTT